jgi:arsenate reductase
MAEITLYHNPNCSKSRGAREILDSSGVQFDIVEYLQDPPSAEEIVAVLGMLDEAPEALVRKDSHFKELGLDGADYTTVETVAALLAEHPRLMQRPIGVRTGKAVIARPSERIKELL